MRLAQQELETKQLLLKLELERIEAEARQQYGVDAARARHSFALLEVLAQGHAALAQPAGAMRQDELEKNESAASALKELERLGAESQARLRALEQDSEARFRALHEESEAKLRALQAARAESERR